MLRKYKLVPRALNGMALLSGMLYLDTLTHHDPMAALIPIIIGFPILAFFWEATD